MSQYKTGQSALLTSGPNSCFPRYVELVDNVYLRPKGRGDSVLLHKLIEGWGTFEAMPVRISGFWRGGDRHADQYFYIIERHPALWDIWPFESDFFKEAVFPAGYHYPHPWLQPLSDAQVESYIKALSQPQPV